jgi:tight adherence protein B
MSLVIQEMPNPMKQEFSLILSENKLGVTLEESFNNLARRIESDDVEMFVTSVNILKETGGNLAETFDTITYTLRERIKLQQKISSMTAQGFYQGVILMCVTPLLGIFFYNSDPEFMKPMFTHPVGWGILFVIAMLEVLGAVMIMKIIKVDV